MSSTIGSLAMRISALILVFSLLVLPQTLNSRSLVLLMDDLGAAPIPLAEEEEVKHACTNCWSFLSHSTNDHLLHGTDVPAVMDDPFKEVEHREVDVPPPKR